MPRPRLSWPLAIAAAICIFQSAPAAHAAPCFATDGDGIFDKDSSINGVIAITAESSSAVPAAADPYDCSSLDFLITAGGLLELDGDPGSGSIAALILDDLTIQAGGAIRADGLGCRPDAGTPGQGPDVNNLCITGGPGAGGSGNDFGGSGGGGHGGRGGNGGIGSGGATYDSATEPVFFGASGGRTGAAIEPGGPGGGVVRILAHSLVHDGVISAHGGAGGGVGNRTTGGGAGGSIYIEVVELGGTTGTFEASGGDGAAAVTVGGGGGGGRIAIAFESSTFDFDAGDFDVSGGTGLDAGANGTVYVHDVQDGIVTIFHGFTFTDHDHMASQWTSTPSATNQYCDESITADATPSIHAATLTFGGSLRCPASIGSFGIVQSDGESALELSPESMIEVHGALFLQAAGDFIVGNDSTISNTRRATDLTIEIADDDDQTWSGVTVDGAREGRIDIDAAIDLSLTNGTSVRGNPRWLNLSSLGVDATSLVSADEKGCDAQFSGVSSAGMAPDCTNVCQRGQRGAGGAGNDFGGSGGGGHGGKGGAGVVGAGGDSFEAIPDPRLFGASAGNTGAATDDGGAGGGLVELRISGALTNDGAITARGEDGGGGGNRITGGGSGGTINIRAATHACTTGGSFSVAGGDGAEPGAGGGGGGRLRVEVDADQCVAAPLAALSAETVAPGGAGGALAGDGLPGTIALSTGSACADPRLVAGQPQPRVVNASDSLMILQTAVGTQCCSLCVCDINDSMSVTATDSLAALKAAVGSEVALDCPACP
ncbi:MAG TPA: hypothetical protein VEC57_12795 [Candidatus Limnocylindrales bacterium]|nr:hypothetical protein [Candidatus Limnocylindrales bacterium]